MEPIRPGVRVQTPLGKGLVRETLNGGRILVDVGPRAVVLRTSEVSVLSDQRTPAPSSTRDVKVPAVGDNTGEDVSREIDLHGLTVEEALGRVDQVLNEALLAGATSLRIIHGRSGGRIRSAVHRRLEAIEAIRSFRLDPRNSGVTVVLL